VSTFYENWDAQRRQYPRLSLTSTMDMIACELGGWDLDQIAQLCGFDAYQTSVWCATFRREVAGLVPRTDKQRALCALVHCVLNPDDVKDWKAVIEATHGMYPALAIWAYGRGYV
jgi:hypothetical protein